MNLVDLVWETIKDNHIDRICHGCLHPEMSHVVDAPSNTAPCTERHCACDNYHQEDDL